MGAHLRIQEPREKIYAYRHWNDAFPDAQAQELPLLVHIHDPEELKAKLRDMLTGKIRTIKNKIVQMRVLAKALELAPRLGESFAEGVLNSAPALLDNSEDLVGQALLLEKGLILAAHFDRE